MKRWLTALPALMLATCIAFAHPPGPPPDEMLDQLAADLGLDDSQKQQVERIFEEQHSRLREERKLLEASGQRPTREEMKARRQQERQALDAQLSTVLTLEQLDKLKQKMEEMRSARPAHKADPPDKG